MDSYQKTKKSLNNEEIEDCNGVKCDICELTERINKSNIEVYREIIDNYRIGKYGDEHLSLNDILVIAGEPNLLR